MKDFCRMCNSRNIKKQRKSVWVKQLCREMIFRVCQDCKSEDWLFRRAKYIYPKVPKKWRKMKVPKQPNEHPCLVCGGMTSTSHREELYDGFAERYHCDDDLCGFQITYDLDGEVSCCFWAEEMSIKRQKLLRSRTMDFVVPDGCLLVMKEELL